MLKIKPTKISGTIIAPSSKSITHRAIFMSFLTHSNCKIKSPLLCADTLASLKAISSFGADCMVNYTGSEKFIEISSSEIVTPNRVINVLNSGTTLRFGTALATLLDEPVILDGDMSIRKRPMNPLLSTLKKMGAYIYTLQNRGTAPLLIKGKINGTQLSISANVSSQFISAIIMVTPLLKNDTLLKVTGSPVSWDYVLLTKKMVEDYGIYISNSDNIFHIYGNQHYRGRDYKVEGDYSSAAYFLLAGAILNTKITIKNLNSNTLQADRKFVEYLHACDIKIKVDSDSVTVDGENSSLKTGYMKFDLHSCPDLLPVLSILSSRRVGITDIVNVQHAEFKESNRIKSSAEMLRAFGVHVIEKKDGLRIYGTGKLKGNNIPTARDHRIFMSGVIGALSADRVSSFVEDNLHSVSYPDFLNQVSKLRDDF